MIKKTPRERRHGVTNAKKQDTRSLNQKKSRVVGSGVNLLFLDDAGIEAK